MTVCPLRKLVQQATNISNFVELQALDPSRVMKIELPGYDELQQIIVSYRDNSYYLELSVPMDDFDWTHPLVLAAGGLTFQEVYRIYRTKSKQEVLKYAQDRFSGWTREMNERFFSKPRTDS